MWAGSTFGRCRGRGGAVVGAQIGNMSGDALAPAAKAAPTAATSAPAPGVVGIGAISALGALDAGDGGGPTGVDTGIPSGDGKVIALACHGGPGKIIIDAARPLINERIVIGITGIGVVHRGVDGGVGVGGLTAGIAAAYALARGFSAAAALSASSLASSAAFSCSAFACASLRSCWACASESSAFFLLCLKLGLGLLELGLVLLEFGLHVVELFDLIDARARDLVGVLQVVMNSPQALRVDQEAHDGIGALLVLVQIAHGGACLGLLLGEAWPRFPRCSPHWSQSAFAGHRVWCGRRCRRSWRLRSFAGLRKLILRCLRGGIRRNGGEHRRGRQRNGEHGARDDTSRLRRDERCGAMIRMLHPVPLQSIVGYGSNGILLLLSTST